MTVHIEIYTTDYCPYCIRAKQLLDRKKVAYTEFNIDQDIARRDEMLRKSNRSSVPQIFVDNHHVGGFDDMLLLDMNEELDPLLFPDENTNE